MYVLYDKQTKAVTQYAVGTDDEYFKKLGMTDEEVEKDYKGRFWLKGYAPNRPQEEIDLENTQTKLNTLNQQLSELKENYVSAILSGNDDVALQIKTQYQTLLNGE